MDKSTRRIVQKADKYIRSRDYRCLFPGCTNKAIWSHAIPRESCAAALADKGVVYTRNPSLCSSIKITSVYDAPEIIEVGVNRASVFKGYCPMHDTLLFRSAETSDRKKKNCMYIAQHLRALSVEHCRKRQVLDFHKKMAQLTDNTDLRKYLLEIIEPAEVIASSFKDLYLGNLFNLISGSDIDSIDYYCVPFSRNLQVSCCGCFNVVPEAFDSVIGYNFISYNDMTILVLTIFNAVKHYLDKFISDYRLPTNGEKLVNDVAFYHCEEPLISARFWRSLDEFQKMRIRLSMRHPNYRTETSGPTIIKISPDDFITKRNPLTTTMLTRLPPRL